MRKFKDSTINFTAEPEIFLENMALAPLAFDLKNAVPDVFRFAIPQDAAALSLSNLVEQGYHSPNLSDFFGAFDQTGQDSQDDGQTISCCACSGCAGDLAAPLSANVSGVPNVNPTENGSGANAVANVASGNQAIDGILLSNKWSDASISYSDPDSTADYQANYNSLVTANPLNGFSQMTAQQMIAVHFGLNDFTYTQNANAAAFSIEGFTNLGIDYAGTDVGTGTLRFANSTDPSVAYAYGPGNGPVNGDSFYNNGGDLPTQGNYDWLTVLHEIGHALGLAHGHETGGFGALPTNMDAMEFSVMTYRSYVGGGTGGYTNETWGYAQTFMMLDIAALQYMYGADFTANSGNTTYSWTPGNGSTVIDGNVALTSGGNRIFATIWDGDGIDTYDLSAYTTALNIDLTPGESSLFSTTQRANLGNSNFASGNIYNALQFNGDARSLIENAIGGSGNDTITGNAADNLLNGGSGNDTLNGGAGNDTFIGGAGDDTFNGGAGTDTLGYSSNSSDISITNSSNPKNGTAVFDGITESYTDIENFVTGSGDDLFDWRNFNQSQSIDGGSGTDTFTIANSGTFSNIDLGGSATSGGGADISLTNIENATGNNNANIITGNSSNNVLIGNGGNDTLDGRGGADTVTGGGGDDTIIFTNGGIFVNDTADGGTGTDTLKIEGFSGTGLGTVNLQAGTWSYLSSGFATSFENFDSSGNGTSAVNITGSSGANIITTSDGNDIINGGAGNDTINGGDGNDILDGGTGSDDVFGGAGDDVINLVNGGIFNDEIADGGTGTDTMVVSGALSSSSTWNMETGAWSFAPFATGLTNFENFDGTDTTGNWTITGTSGTNMITTGTGNDVIEGGAGADMLDGGVGTDTLSYAGAANGVQVDLSAGTGSTNDASGDTFSNFENFTGSSLDDSITAGGAFTLVEAGDGRDFFRFDGSSSYTAATYDGEAGNDAIFFGDEGSLDLSALIFENIEEIQFFFEFGTTRTLTLSGDQFGAGLISLTSLIDSNEVDPDNLVINMGTNTTLDLSGLTFSGWNTGGFNDDSITIVSTTDGETITGTSQDDTLIENFLQFDNYDGGDGIDTFIYDELTYDFTWNMITGEASFSSTIINFENAVGSDDAAQSDLITGTSGANVIDARAGDDDIRAGDGNDTVDGGAGDDALYGQNDDDTLNGGLGNDSLLGGNGNDTVNGGAGNDFMNGQGGDDILNGGDGIDDIFGASGNDTIDAGNGDDSVNAGGGNDTVDGGEGNDDLRGAVGFDTINGGNGDDVISGGNQNDMLNGDAGADTLNGDAGNDIVNGGGDNDTLIGASGQDILNGDAGDDNLSGNAGGDDLFGGIGNDTLNGGGGNDDLNGGTGADVFVANLGLRTDRIQDFEDGVDLIDFSGNVLANDIGDVLAAATQVGANVRIDLNANNILILEGFDLADLDASDFVF